MFSLGFGAGALQGLWSSLSGLALVCLSLSVSVPVVFVLSLFVPTPSPPSHCFHFNVFVFTGCRPVATTFPFPSPSALSLHIFYKTFIPGSFLKGHRNSSYLFNIFSFFFPLIHLHSTILLWCENRKELCLNSTTLVPCGSDPESAISQFLLQEREIPLQSSNKEEAEFKSNTFSKLFL